MTPCEENDCEYLDIDRCTHYNKRPKWCTCQLPRALAVDKIDDEVYAVDYEKEAER